MSGATTTDTTGTETSPPVEAVETTEETQVAADATETPDDDLGPDVIEVPDSSAEGGIVKLVPGSALRGARTELKEVKEQLKAAKAGSERATQLEQQVNALQGQIEQLRPIAEAYQAAIQQPAPRTGNEPAPEERAALEEIARDFDFYKGDGGLDLEKAARHQQRTRVEAERIAKATVAPYEQQTADQRAVHHLQRALATEVNGVKADPAILKSLWSRPELRASAATEEGAKHLLVQAIGMTILAGKGAPATGATRNANGQFAAAEIPPPLHTERAGGRETAGDAPLSPSEKQSAKDLGLTEAEYLASARNAPWLNRK